MAGHLAALVLLALFSVCMARTTVTIAGVFDIFNKDGYVDNMQLQNLAAFKMAIEEARLNATVFPDLSINYAIIWFTR